MFCMGHTVFVTLYKSYCMSHTVYFILYISICICHTVYVTLYMSDCKFRSSLSQYRAGTTVAFQSGEIRRIYILLGTTAETNSEKCFQ